MIDLEYIKRKKCIIYEVVSGSKAYGLNHKDSDTDIRGVFILPQDVYYGFDYIEQVSDDTNDTVYYELRKFIRLLSKSNPSIIEMINTPREFVLYRAAFYPKFNMNKILSKECFNTFAKYAYSQVRKARGLNKKIVNPMNEKRKEPLDFCTIINNGKTKLVKEWIKNNDIEAGSCGLVNMDKCRDLYALYWEGNDNPFKFRGIVQSEDSTSLSTSSVPKNINAKVYLSYNADGFKKHCRKYKEYWEWVDKRNDARFAQTVEHGKNYDSKNMMHTFRLLAMAEEIITEGYINVTRADKEFLLSIKAGNFEYEQLLDMAEEKINALEKLYFKSNIRETPDVDYLEQLLINVRKDAYNMKNTITKKAP